MRLSRFPGIAATWLENRFEPDPRNDGAGVVPPEKARAVVASFFMPNISRRVVAAQRKLLKRFVPPDVAIDQVETLLKHGAAMTAYMRATRYPVVLFLDIDCVPIRPGAIEALLDRAEQGRLAGAVHRANHHDNNQHLYVGPFCLAISRETYERLGEPDFAPTARGDVGEELTFAAERKGVPVDLSWPVSSDDLIWDLADGRRYGHGTTYDGGFWHAFQIRHREHQTDFIAPCDTFLAAAGAAA